MHDIIIAVLIILLVIGACYIVTLKQIDMYTSAQPPPPFSKDVSSNIVYPDNMQIKQHPILGLDCTGTNCDTVYNYYGYPYTGYYGRNRPYGYYNYPYFKHSGFNHGDHIHYLDGDRHGIGGHGLGHGGHR